MNSVRAIPALLVALTIAACGADTEGSADATTADVPAETAPDDVAAEVAQDATAEELAPGPWTTPPAGAVAVTAEELQALGTAGTLVEFTPGRQAQAAAALEQQIVEDASTLSQLYAARPELEARIERAPGAGAKVLPDGNYQIQVSDGQGGTFPVTTYGGQTRKHQIATAYRRFNTVDNQVAIYQAAYPLLPDDCVDGIAGLPDPATVTGLTLDELKTLNRQIAACWRTATADFGPSGGTAPDVTDSTKFEGAPTPPDSGYSGDFGGTGCKHGAKGLYAMANWTGKAHDSDVKNQGRRGSCVSFGISGAMEQAIHRIEGRRVNLSEQALYAKAKIDWAPNDLADGLPTTDIIDKMTSTGFALPFEQIWPYNSSPYRESCGDPGCGGSPSDPGNFKWSCENPDRTDPYQGPACSETVHQAKLVHHNGHAYYWTPTTAANGVFGIHRWVELDDLEDPLGSNLATMYLGMGYGVVLSFDVWKSFKEVVTSNVKAADFDQLPDSVGHWDYAGLDGDEYLGGHAIAASGFLTAATQDYSYIVVKNSWGKCWADAGYAYMALSVAQDVLNDATAILPKELGFNSAPVLKVVAPVDGQHFMLGGVDNAIHFEASATDVEDGSACCGWKWTLSPGSGTASTATRFDRVFTAPGTYTVTVAATDSLGKKAKKTLTIHVDDDAPVAQILAPVEGEVIYRNTTYVLQGEATDVNQPAGVKCMSMAWTSSVAADVTGAPGCIQQVVFATNGPRTLTLTVTDDAGVTGKATVDITVQDAPPKDPPVVTITYPLGTLASPKVVDPSVAATMNATVVSPGGFPNCPTGSPDCVSYAWSTRIVDVGAFKPLGTTKDLTWTPKAVFGNGCSTFEVEVQLCSTDPNGTTCKSVWLFLAYPAC